VNQQQMLLQLQRMQQEMEKAQQELAATEVSGSAGGGTVTVAMNGHGETKAVRIDPAAVDPDDVEMLEDLIVAAVNEARRAADALQKQRMAGATGGLADLAGGLGLNLPGM
jgi:nucleoid-associated protein EbfC